MKFQKHTKTNLLIIGIVTLFAVVGRSGLCHGHALFIQAARYHLSQGKQSPLFFCYGHHVPVDDGVRAKKLKAVNIHTPSGKIEKKFDKAQRMCN